MVKNSNKNHNTNTNVNSDDDKINNNINIKIDLGDLTKPKPKPRKKTKPKPKTLDDLKSGATIGSASSIAPLKMGSVKMPSLDNGFNPNSSYNMLLLQALQNAFKNRQIPQTPAITPSAPQLNITGPLQQTITGPASVPAITGPSSVPAITGPVSVPAITGPTSPQALPPPSASPTISQFYSTSQMGNLQPNPQIQTIPTTQQTINPTSIPSGLTTVPTTPLNTQQIFNPMAQYSQTAGLNTLPSSPTISALAPSTTAPSLLNLTTALSSIAPPEIGDWNKDLLDLYSKEKGKKTYGEIKKNPNMVQYADDVAKYLLRTNPDLEGKIKKAIANPTAKSTTEPDGYRPFLPYLNQVIEQKASELPYFKDTTRTKLVSELKKMFFKRFKNQIYTPDEIKIIEGTDIEIPEEEEEPTPVASTPSIVQPLVPTTLITNPPLISSTIPPPPPPPPPLALAPPPPPPPPPPSGASKIITLFDKKVDDRDIAFIDKYNEDYIEGDDPQFIDKDKMIEIKRLKETGLFNIETIIDIINGKKNETDETKKANEIILDKQKKAKEEQQKKEIESKTGNIIGEIKAKAKKTYENNVSKILTSFEGYKDNQDIKKIKDDTNEKNKLKRFTKVYKEVVKDKTYNKFDVKLDEDTIKDVYERLEKTGFFS